MSTNLAAVQTAITAYQNGTQTLEQAILAAIAEARTTCDVNGNNSADCAAAWDIIEKLQSEKAHQQPAKIRKTFLEIYCEEHPGAVECLIYDV
ncbi:Calvin cycle protein CP12 [Fortiea contorta]|uniref:Calvin cycle protein CP12 n=1 Tax=Fortiea contorta TaxID=1892405 RepID=UPI00036ED2DC|nr:Calvin cycle protein CP12 [Fortiea contorta]